MTTRTSVVTEFAMKHSLCALSWSHSRSAAAGCFVLVRTSNPGAAELQDEGSPPLYEKLATVVARIGAAHAGDCGLSLVGAVTGATQPGLLARLRELMPQAIFLLPGVGAQGGRVEDLGAAFAPHPAAGLVTASRAIVNAHARCNPPAVGRRPCGRRGRGRGGAPHGGLGPPRPLSAAARPHPPTGGIPHAD